MNKPTNEKQKNKEASGTGGGDATKGDTQRAVVLDLSTALRSALRITVLGRETHPLDVTQPKSGLGHRNKIWLQFKWN